MDAQQRFGSDFILTAEKGNLPGLRSHLTSAIKWEPAIFLTENGNYTQMRKYLLEELHIDFRQPYERQPGEEDPWPSGQWDADYFFRLVEWYRRNCADARLKHIAEVGKVVARASETAPPAQQAARAKSADFHAVPEERRNRAHQKSRPNPVLLLLAAALLLAGLLAAVLRLSRKPQESSLPPVQPAQISQTQDRSILQ